MSDLCIVNEALRGVEGVGEKPSDIMGCCACRDANRTRKRLDLAIAIGVYKSGKLTVVVIHTPFINTVELCPPSPLHPPLPQVLT